MERPEAFEQLQTLLEDQAQLLRDIEAIIQAMQLAVQCIQLHFKQEQQDSQ